jgi:hypothetical protein
MKVLVLFLILAISTQPMAAGSCHMDPEKGQQSTHHMDMSQMKGHDCCDPGDKTAPEGCDPGMKCGPCFLSVPVLPELAAIDTTWNHPVLPAYLPGAIVPGPSSPPFRPPIS